MKIYSLKSKSLNYLNMPFVANDDKEVIMQLRDAIQKNSDSSLVTNIEDIQIVCYGQFDPSLGLVLEARQARPCDEGRLIEVIPYAIDFDLTVFLPRKEAVAPHADSKTV